MPALAMRPRNFKPLPSTLTETVDVETPELVVLSYEIADVGSRALAAIVDFLAGWAPTWRP